MLSKFRQREFDIPPGQRFRAHDGSLWEFSHYVPIHGDLPHVSLIRVTDAYTTKVVSMDALFDTHLFRPAE